MGEKIVVDADDLTCLVGYVYSLLEFIDVDDFEEEENRNLVVKGFDDYVKPMIRNDFESPFTFVKNDEVEVFREQLEDGFDIDTSAISFGEMKEFYNKVLEQYNNEANEIYCNIVTDLIHEKGLNEKSVDEIIADATAVSKEQTENEKAENFGFEKE